MTRPPPTSPLFPTAPLSRPPPAGEVRQRVLEGDREPRREKAENLRKGLHAGEPHPAHDHDADHRSEEHTSELQSQSNLVCRLLLETKDKFIYEIATLEFPVL